MRRFLVPIHRPFGFRGLEHTPRRDSSTGAARPSAVFWVGVIQMVKRIAVFAALVLGYALTGMALNAGQTGSVAPQAAVEASAVE